MKKNIIYALLSLSVVAAAGLAYYFTFLHDTRGIKPPLTLQIPYDTLQFRAEDGFAYHHFTGTNIRIPANAFVDKDGFPVNGNVQLFYREFHSPEDILLSGIPMGKINDEKERALQSAGMFEMKAFSGRDELQVAEGKHINVQLAAFPTSGDNKVFQMNQDFEWEERGTPALVANEQKELDCAAIPVLPPKPTNPCIGENDKVIDIDANYYDQPPLKAFEKYRWKLAEHPDNKTFDDWMFRVNWDKLKIERVDQQHNLFKLTFKSTLTDYENRSFSKSCSVIVMPVLSGADYEQALAEFNQDMKEYQIILGQVKKEEERLALEADALNAFSINKMGVWNCDRIIDESQYVKIKATFDFASELNPYVNKIKVYVINHTENTVQNYFPWQWNSIYLDPKSVTSLMAVLPNNKIAVFSKQQFTKVDFRAASREFFFQTQSFSAGISEKSKLKELL